MFKTEYSREKVCKEIIKTVIKKVIMHHSFIRTDEILNEILHVMLSSTATLVTGSLQKNLKPGCELTTSHIDDILPNIFSAFEQMLKAPIISGDIKKDI